MATTASRSTDNLRIVQPTKTGIISGSKGTSTRAIQLRFFGYEELLWQPAATVSGSLLPPIST
jgi:hypothetical protein